MARHTMVTSHRSQGLAIRCAIIANVKYTAAAAPPPHEPDHKRAQPDDELGTPDQGHRRGGGGEERGPRCREGLVDARLRRQPSELPHDEETHPHQAQTEEQPGQERAPGDVTPRPRARRGGGVEFVAAEEGHSVSFTLEGCHPRLPRWEAPAMAAPSATPAPTA